MENSDYFNIVSNKDYRKILLRDFAELEMCYEHGLHKSTVVLAGSLLEAILIEYFISRSEDENHEKRILKLKLYQLIDKAEENELITSRTKNLSSVVRDYRNYIHPAKEVRTKDTIDGETATIAKNLLTMILKEVFNNYDKSYGHRAEVLFEKMQKDKSTYVIFDKLIENTNKNECNRLLELLIEGYLNSPGDDDNYRKFLFKYYKKIRPHLSDNVVKEYLLKLYSEVESGSDSMVEIYFDIFGNELNLLEDDQVDTIIDYMYEHISEPGYGDDRLPYFLYSHIYTYLNLYKDKKEHKEKLLKLLVSIVRTFHKKKDNDVKYLQIFEMLSRGISDDALLPYIKKNMYQKNNFEAFKNRWEEFNELPF